MTPTRTVKNKSLKMSPGGLITLPVSARKALGMIKGESANVAVKVDNGNIILNRTSSEGLSISPKGMFTLPAEAKRVLAAAAKRHYWFEAFDKERQVTLHPFRS